MDPVLCEGGDDFLQSVSNVLMSSKRREARPEDIQFAGDFGGIVLLLVQAQMVVTEFLSAKSDGAAGDAVGFDEGASGRGHDASRKAVSRQLSAVSHSRIVQAATNSAAKYSSVRTGQCPIKSG
jgi:hypothetical protein